MKILTETEKAYLAGIIDGEGSIYAYQGSEVKNGKEYSYWRVQVSIVNTNKGIIRYCNNLLEVKSLITRDRFGRLPIHRIFVSDRVEVLLLLTQILPYLKSTDKIEKATSVINHLSAIKLAGGFTIPTSSNTS